MAKKTQFKVGQKVKLVKNLGIKGGYGDGNYLYGHPIEALPLNTKVVIQEVSKEDAFQKYIKVTFNNREIYIHPDEVQAASSNGDDAIASFLREQVKHPLIELSENAPVFVLDNKVYSISNEESGNSFLEEGNKRSVSEVESLDSLDELLSQRGSEQIRNLGLGYAEEIKADFKHDNFDRDLDTAQLIYKNVLPYLRTDGYDAKIAGVLGVLKPRGEKQKQSEELERRVEVSFQIKKIAGELYRTVEDIIEEIKIENYFGEEERKNKRQRRSEKQIDLDNLLSDEIDRTILDDLLTEKAEPYRGRSLLGKAINLRDFAILDGKIYSLTPASNETKLIIEGRRYDLSLPVLERRESREGNPATTDEAQDRFYHEFSKGLRIDALKSHLSIDKLTELLQDQNAELLAIRGKREYSEGDFGFLEHKGTYYVFLTVPEFALKSFDRPGTYYFHDKMRIGQAVNKDGARISFSSQPIAIDNNGHMYMHDNSGEFIGICFGEHSIPSSGKDNGEVIAKRLRSTRDMMLFGYREFPDYYSKYRKSPMTLDQVNKKGILVTSPYGKR